MMSMSRIEVMFSCPLKCLSNLTSRRALFANIFLSNTFVTFLIATCSFFSVFLAALKGSECTLACICARTTPRHTRPDRALEWIHTLHQRETAGSVLETVCMALLLLAATKRNDLLCAKERESFAVLLSLSFLWKCNRVCVIDGRFYCWLFFILTTHTLIYFIS